MVDLGTDIVLVDYITIEGSIPLALRGATLPYYEIEAEDATTNGVIIGPDRTYTKLPSEASGRRAVQVTGNQYVEFTLTGPANGLVIRFSIPDAPQGQGLNGMIGLVINGNTKMNVPVTSHFSYSYGNYPFNKSPGSGTPHHFYDDVRVKLESTLPTGTKIRLQGLTDLVYTIDLVDFYTIPAAYPEPANFLNIVTAYGADPTGQKDSTQAFQKALADGVSQNKGVWIPTGNFHVNQRFTLGKVVVRGAGPWYSIVTATVNHGVGFFANFGANPRNAFELYDFSMIGDTNDRDDGAVDSGVGGSPDSVVVQNVWIEHCKCGMWVDGPFASFSVIGVTIRNTFADGINFHIGVTNGVVQQSIFRNTGDDALAMWSQNQPDKNNVFKFNTIQVPVLANGIAIYGGSDNSGTDSIISDTICEGAGFQASNRFGSVALAGTTTFTRNTVHRCGSGAHDNSSWDGAVWFWAQDSNINGIISVKDIEIINSTWSGILFWGAGTQFHNCNFSNITIDGTGTYAIEVQGPTGEVSMDHIVAKNLRWGGYCSYEPQTFKIQYGDGNVGWDTNSKCYS